MASSILTSVGLVLDILGALMLVRYGLPIAPMDEHGTLFDSNLAMMGMQHPDAVAIARTYKVWSRIALGLIVLGFVFQLIAVWVP